MGKSAPPTLTAPAISGPGYPAGIEFALAMFEVLENDQDLATSCDMGYDAASAKRPHVNILLRYLETVIATGDDAAVEGFCALVSGFIGAAVCGCVLEASYMRDIAIKRMVAAGVIARQAARRPRGKRKPATSGAGAG